MIVVFSYRNNALPSMPIVDCRGMRNPYPDKQSTDEEKIASITNDPMFNALVQMAITAHRIYGDVGIGCTHGMHRSVAVTRAVNRELLTQVVYSNSERIFE